MSAPTSIADDDALAELVARFERSCPSVDGVWGCDVGAACAAYLADKLGLQRRLCSGLYWHASAQDCNRSIGEADDAFARREEAHCWLEIERPYGWVRLDPNGERVAPQPVPRLTLVGDCDAYEQIGDFEIDCVGFEAHEHIEALAQEFGGDFMVGLQAVQSDLRRAL